MQEPEGFAKCPRYGKDFVVKAVLPDGRLVPCKRGETPEKVRARFSAKPPISQSAAPSAHPACGINLFDL